MLMMLIKMMMLMMMMIIIIMMTHPLQRTSSAEGVVSKESKAKEIKA